MSLLQTDFGVQRLPCEKHWSKAFCLAPQCRTQDFITQMSPCQKAFPGLTISMPSLYSVLSYSLYLSLSEMFCP